MVGLVGYLTRGALLACQSLGVGSFAIKGEIVANIFKEVPAGCLLHWTPAAVTCYKSGCNCSTCIIIKDLETITPKNCSMKAVVLELVRRLGIPKQ